MLRNIITVITKLLSILTLYDNGKTESIKVWDALQSRRGKIYFNQQGQFMGCDGVLECMAFNVVFYAVSYDRNKNQFNIGGTIYIDGTSKDSVKLGGVRIYL